MFEEINLTRYGSMEQPTDLSLEQKFALRSFESQVKSMSLEQAQDFLVKLYDQMMRRETMYQHLLKHEWGIVNAPVIGDGKPE
jgi:hypothetical protein